MSSKRQVHVQYEGAGRPALALTMALAVLYASVSSSQNTDAVPPAETTCTQTLQARHSDAAEARALDETGGRVVREGCTLRFRTPRGEHALTSNLSVGAEHLGYQRYLVGEPVVSPDRRRVVATSLDLVAAISPNALEIWRLEDQFATLELSIGSYEWGPSDATWVDAATIAFTQNFTPFGDRTETGRLRFTPSGWLFEPGVASGPVGGR